MKHNIICSKCWGINERNGQRYCLACHNEFMRKTRPKYKDLPDYQKAKSRARAIANAHQKRGKIKKQNCLICNSDKAQKHHPDYSKPLEIIWLCRPCHRLEHHKIEMEGKKEFNAYVEQFLKAAHEDMERSNNAGDKAAGGYGSAGITQISQ